MQRESVATKPRARKTEPRATPSVDKNKFECGESGLQAALRADRNGEPCGAHHSRSEWVKSDVQRESVATKPRARKTEPRATPSVDENKFESGESGLQAALRADRNGEPCGAHHSRSEWVKSDVQRESVATKPRARKTEPRATPSVDENKFESGESGLQAALRADRNGEPCGAHHSRSEWVKSDVQRESGLYSINGGMVPWAKIDRELPPIHPGVN